MSGVDDLAPASAVASTASDPDPGLRVLVWQWGRFGAMPRFAALLAEALRKQPGVTAMLSLSRGAELMRSATAPRCELPVDTYNGLAGFIGRLMLLPFSLPRLVRRLVALRPDLAICVQAAALDPLMLRALRRLRVPYIVVVHDADIHPGDGLPLQMRLQRLVCRDAVAIAALSRHVAGRLQAQRLVGAMGGGRTRPLIQLSHPPVAFAMPPVPVRGDGGLRLLMFGRLLAYKGLDLLAGALRRLGPVPGLEVRIVGSGADPRQLRALQALPGVTVEDRWVPEPEIGALLAWSDALILPYREASQSGVAAAALACGRWVVATRVGGLVEQLRDAERAILCEPDEASLAVALQQLLDAASAHAAREGASQPAKGGDAEGGDAEEADAKGVDAKGVDAGGADAGAAWRAMAASLMQQITALGLSPASRRH